MILVTGGTGFIGTHTVRALCEAGEECVLAQRRTTEVPDQLADLPVEVARVDVTDRESLRAVGRDRNISGIVNLAIALPWNDPDTPAIDGARQAVNGFLNVVSAAQEWGVRRVVTASTIGVYGGTTTEGGLTEDLPLSVGQSHVIPTFKKMFELLGGHLTTETDVEVVSARISGTWGLGGHLPDPFFAAPSMTYAAAHRTAPDFSQMLAQPRAGDGLDLCYVKDTGRMLALLQLTEELHHTTYNVSSGHVTTNLEVIDALRRVEPDFAVDLPEGGEASTWLDNGRLREDTGFEPEWDLERSAADYVAWLRDGHAQ